MPILPIIQRGDPMLRRVAKPVDQRFIESEECANLLRNMVETLDDSGGIGLAAPQIAVSRRIAILSVPETRVEAENIPPLPLTICINPSIEVLSNEVNGYWEGCLSVPDLQGYVERPNHVKVDFVNADGKAESIEATGFLATVFQHEFDHLDGILYVDRIFDPSLIVDTRALLSEDTAEVSQ